MFIVLQSRTSLVPMKTLILAGGVGTRLFPLSRELYPKQFIPLFDGETLFQKTLKRALHCSRPEEISIVSGEQHAFLVRDQLEGVCKGCLTLTEPEGKNTLPAVLYGISRMVEQHGHSTVAVLPSDHLVPVTDGYQKAMENAEKLSSHYLVTFGIPPDHPHTGYGYIKPGEAVDGGYGVDRFVEKPDKATAEDYIRRGYYWNSGIFMFSTELFLQEVQAHAPAVASAFRQPLAEAYARTPSISIDYGLMEKTSRAAVVVLDAPWSDVGSFDALYRILPKDPQGNAVQGEAITLDSYRNLILGERLIATIGISDLTIVDTKDVLLVGDRTRSQEIRGIVDRLKSERDERVVLHTTVHRPWGSYTILEKGPFYTIKRITVLPQRQISLQLHHHRSEHWVVVQGTAEIELQNERRFLRNGESTFVPAGSRHRLRNPGLLPLELIEVQQGEYIGEDDIIRFEDDFGRK
jgi:mannose-1-phosphate guanylyltransferase/mannose-6-phosphate isomerase